jgi:hypothetical protein
MADDSDGGRLPPKERAVDSKAIRTIVIFGIMATFALTIMMMFTLDSMTDTQTPKIAADLAQDFSRALAPAPPAAAKLSMIKEGAGEDARRVYKLHIRPNDAVANDAPALSRLMYHTAEYCVGAIGDVRSEVVVRCIAELPGGREKEAIFVKDKASAHSGADLIHAVAAMPPASAPSALPASPDR